MFNMSRKEIKPNEEVESVNSGVKIIVRNSIHVVRRVDGNEFFIWPNIVELENLLKKANQLKTIQLNSNDKTTINISIDRLNRLITDVKDIKKPDNYVIDRDDLDDIISKFIIKKKERKFESKYHEFKLLMDRYKEEIK